MRLLGGSIVLLLLVGSTVAGGDDLGVDARRLLDSAWRMARSSKIREHQVERLTAACGKVSVEEIGEVIDRLRAREKPGKSLPEVLAVLDREWGLLRFGPEPMGAIPDLVARIRSGTAEDTIALLSAGLTLEDLRFAKRIALVAARAEEPAVRVRAVVALGDLLNYGEEDEALSKTLLGLLADPDAGVRSLACRRAFEVRLDPVFSWAVDHLEDGEKGRFSLRGEDVRVRPGEEALRNLQSRTRIQEELEYREYRGLSAEQRASIRGLFSAWWGEGGESFPAPGFREGRFRRKASAVKRLVLDPGTTTASFRIWSGLDRTRIRVGIDEIEQSASSECDLDVNFHLRYMVQGMRSDDGEAYRRHFPVGERFVLARKKSGCYVLVFQALAGGRLRIHFRFYDPVQ